MLVLNPKFIYEYRKVETRMKQFDTIKNNEWIPTEFDLDGMVRVEDKLPTATSTLLGQTFMLTSAQDGYVKSHFYKCVGDETEGYSWSDLNVGRFAVGNCTNIKMRIYDETSSLRVIMSWCDPEDLEVGSEVIRWKETRLVHQVGHMPLTADDGDVLVTSVVRNQYSSLGTWSTSIAGDLTRKHYFKLFPVSDDGSITNDDQNGRCAGWNYVITGDSLPYTKADNGGAITYTYKTYYSRELNESTGLYEYKAIDYTLENFARESITEDDGTKVDVWVFKTDKVYYEYQNSYLNWEGIRDLVRAGEAEKYFPCGTTLVLPYHGDFGEMTFEVVDYDNVQTVDTSIKHTMTLESKYLNNWWDYTTTGFVFDSEENAIVQTNDSGIDRDKVYFAYSGYSDDGTWGWRDTYTCSKLPQWNPYKRNNIAMQNGIIQYSMGGSQSSDKRTRWYGSFLPVETVFDARTYYPNDIAYNLWYMGLRHTNDSFGRDGCWPTRYECELPYTTQFMKENRLGVRQSRGETDIYDSNTYVENNRPASEERIPSYTQSGSRYYLDELDKYTTVYAEPLGGGDDTTYGRIQGKTTNVSSDVTYSVNFREFAEGWQPYVYRPCIGVGPRNNGYSDRFMRVPYRAGTAATNDVSNRELFDIRDYNQWSYWREYDDGVKYYIPVELAITKFRSSYIGNTTWYVQSYTYLRDATMDLAMIMNTLYNYSSSTTNAQEYLGRYINNRGTGWSSGYRYEPDLTSVAKDFLHFPTHDEVFLIGKKYWKLEIDTRRRCDIIKSDREYYDDNYITWHYKPMHQFVHSMAEVTVVTSLPTASASNVGSVQFVSSTNVFWQCRQKKYVNSGSDVGFTAESAYEWKQVAAFSDGDVYDVATKQWYASYSSSTGFVVSTKYHQPLIWRRARFDEYAYPSTRVPVEVIESTHDLPADAQLAIDESGVHFDDAHAYIYKDPLTSIAGAQYFALGQRHYDINSDGTTLPLYQVKTRDGKYDTSMTDWLYLKKYYVLANTVIPTTGNTPVYMCKRTINATTGKWEFLNVDKYENYMWTYDGITPLVEGNRDFRGVDVMKMMTADSRGYSGYTAHRNSRNERYAWKYTDIYEAAISGYGKFNRMVTATTMYDKATETTPVSGTTYYTYAHGRYTSVGSSLTKFDENKTYYKIVSIPESYRKAGYTYAKHQQPDIGSNWENSYQHRVEEFPMMAIYSNNSNGISLYGNNCDTYVCCCDDFNNAVLACQPEQCNIFFKTPNLERVMYGNHVWAQSNVRMYLNGPFDSSSVYSHPSETTFHSSTTYYKYVAGEGYTTLAQVNNDSLIDSTHYRPDRSISDWEEKYDTQVYVKYAGGTPIGYKLDVNDPTKYNYFGISPVMQYKYNSLTKTWYEAYSKGYNWWEAQPSVNNGLAYDRLAAQYRFSYVTAGDAANSTPHVVVPGKMSNDYPMSRTEVYDYDNGNTCISLGDVYTHTGGHDGEMRRSASTLPFYTRYQTPRQSFLHGFLDCRYKRTNDREPVSGQTYYARDWYGDYVKIDSTTLGTKSPYKNFLYVLNENYTNDIKDAAEFLECIVPVVNRNGLYGMASQYDFYPHAGLTDTTNSYDAYGKAIKNLGGTICQDKVWLMSTNQIAGGTSANNGVYEEWSGSGNGKWATFVTDTERALYGYSLTNANGHKYALKHWAQMNYNYQSVGGFESLNASRIKYQQILGQHRTGGYADYVGAAQYWWLRSAGGVCATNLRQPPSGVIYLVYGIDYILGCVGYDAYSKFATENGRLSILLGGNPGSHNYQDTFWGWPYYAAAGGRLGADHAERQAWPTTNFPLSRAYERLSE